MRDELRRRMVYAIERLLVRGAMYRFLVVVAFIGLVSVAGGMLLVTGGAPESLSEATWWAFLRLSDPGYLGDDEGVWRRTVSTTLTVLGYVIFLGAMVAILTQWLNDTLNKLERGLTPIRQSGHIVILGWTNRTRTICTELVTAEGQLSRWLARRRVRRLRVAILDRKIGPERDAELRAALGKHYRRNTFVLRSGSYLRANHLRRVDLAHAASVVLPGVEATATRADDHDATVIKTLRAIAAEHRHAEVLPTCVCEIFDPRKVPVAELAYGGPLEVLPSDIIIGRVLGDSLRRPGASAVLGELLTHGVGGTLYVRTWEDEASTVQKVLDRAPAAIFLGVVRAGQFDVAPPADAEVRTDDGLVFVARTFDDTAVEGTLGGTGTRKLVPVEIADGGGGGRVLMLGWSRRMPDLFEQLDRRTDERWTVDVLSAHAAEKRRADMESHGATLVRTIVNQHLGDLTLPKTLEGIAPASYDRILLVASDWPADTDGSDARTISTYIALQSILQGMERSPPILVELADDGNVDLFDAGRTEVVVSPRILSRVLAQVVLRRELRVVIDEIFGQGRTQVRFVQMEGSGTIEFGDLSASLRGDAMIAIGIRRGGLGGELVLVPSPDTLVSLGGEDRVIVIDPGEVAVD